MNDRLLQCVCIYILVYHRAGTLLPDKLKGTNRKGRRLYIHGWKTKYLNNQVTKAVRDVRENLLNCLEFPSRNSHFGKYGKENTK